MTISNKLKVLTVATVGTILSSLSVDSAFAASFQGLGDLDLAGERHSSRALGVSADGSTVVGYTRGEGTEAFRWTEDGGLQGLGYLDGGGFGFGFDSQANGVSADGSTVVGDSNGASGNEAFRWTEDGGMQGLGDLDGGRFSSRALGVSADGSTVVGYTRGDGTEAFLWTEDGGMQGLGYLDDRSFYSRALGVSADGSTVVGDSTGASGAEAFHWTEDGGMRSLKDLLTNEYGLDLTGWSLSSARGVSADGLTIVGTGRNPDGITEGWIARLGVPQSQSVPEPASMLGLLSIAAFGTVSKIKRKNKKV